MKMMMILKMTLMMRGRWRTTGDVFWLWSGLAPSACLSDNFTQASLSKRPSDWVIGRWLILCCSRREQTFELMTLQVVCLWQAGTLVLQLLKQWNKQNSCDGHTKGLYGQSLTGIKMALHWLENKQTYYVWLLSLAGLYLCGRRVRVFPPWKDDQPCSSCSRLVIRHFIEYALQKQWLWQKQW